MSERLKRVINFIFPTQEKEAIGLPGLFPGEIIVLQGHDEEDRVVVQIVNLPMPLDPKTPAICCRVPGLGKEWVHFNVNVPIASANEDYLSHCPHILKATELEKYSFGIDSIRCFTGCLEDYEETLVGLFDY